MCTEAWIPSSDFLPSSVIHYFFLILLNSIIRMSNLEDIHLYGIKSVFHQCLIWTLFIIWNDRKVYPLNKHFFSSCSHRIPYSFSSKQENISLSWEYYQNISVNHLLTQSLHINYSYLFVQWCILCTKIDLDYIISYTSGFLRHLINLCSFFMTMSCVMFACCTTGSVARNLIIINTRAYMHARTHVHTYVPSFCCCYNVQHTETPWNDNDDSKGDDQFSFLSNLAFCRQWQLLLSVSLSMSRDRFPNTTLHFSNIIHTLLISIFVYIYWTCRVRSLTIFMFRLICYCCFYLFTWPIHLYVYIYIYDLVLLILFKFNHHQLEWTSKKCIWMIQFMTP
jgi:hypothetical protein